MGAKPYRYVVAYQADIPAALQALRADVFRRGEFLGADQGYATPEEALAMSEEGTHSILDISKVSDEPASCTASSLDDEELQHYFGTARPTRADIESNDEIYEEIDRGSARYIVAYEGDHPKHIIFLGYSFD